MYEFDVYAPTCNGTSDAEAVITLPERQLTYCPYCGEADCLEEYGELYSAKVGDDLADFDLNDAHQRADSQSLTAGGDD